MDILEWIREVLEEYGGSKGARQELEKVRKALDGLPKTAENYGLVHYDFEPDNVFWDASERVCRVIDFDDGIYCWYALDLAQVWDSLEDELEGEKERLPEIKKTFLEGYAEEYAYTQETESMLALMRRFVNLRSYARLIRCVSSRMAEEAGLAGGAEGEAEWKNPGAGGWFQVSRSHKCGPSDIYSIRNMVTVWQGNILNCAGRCFAPAVKK